VGGRRYAPPGAGPRQAGADPLANHRPLELREDAKHVKHCLAGGRAGVERLLVQIEPDARGAQLPQHRHQVLQRSPEAIHGPDGEHVELAARGRPQHRIEPWPAIASLGTGDAFVGILGYQLPAGALRHGH
jgi:hypothetical protein